MADSSFFTAVVSLAGVATAVTVILVFSRRAYGFFSAPVRWFIRQNEAATKIGRIYAEVTMNGTGSMTASMAKFEKKQSSHSLCISLNEQMIRGILNDASHGVFHSDSTGKCLWVNPAYCKMVGRLPEDILGDGWQSYIHADDRDRVLNEWQRVVSSNREFGSRYRFTNGLQVDAIAHPLRDEIKTDGVPGKLLLGYQGTVRMIVELEAVKT